MREDTKLTKAKIRFAEEGRFLTGTTSTPDDDRIPPGQGLVKGFPVLDLGIKPEITPEQWSLRIYGAVEAEVTISWQDLINKLPQTDIVVDIHCVTAWTHLDCSWRGVLTNDLMKLIALKPAAKFVMIHGSDGYSTNLSLEDFLEESCLIAHTMKGEPLKLDHGAPARLVLSTLYFWKSPKWISAIEFLTEDQPGYWEQRSYHNRGNPWYEERYGTPVKPAPAPAPAPVELDEPEPLPARRKSSFWDDLKQFLS